MREGADWAARGAVKHGHGGRERMWVQARRDYGKASATTGGCMHGHLRFKIETTKKIGNQEEELTTKLEDMVGEAGVAGMVQIEARLCGGRRGRR